MTPPKKLFIAAAILATGFCLAWMCGAPRESDSAIVGSARNANGLPARSRTSGTDSARLLPDVAASRRSSPLLSQTPAGLRASSPVAHLTGMSRGEDEATAAAPANAIPASQEAVATMATTTPAPPPRAAVVPATFEAPAQARRDPVPAGPIERPELDDFHAPRTHVVIDGDSLGRLAQRYLDDPRRGDEIFRLNQGVLTDPDLLPIGLELRIPPRPLPESTSQALGTWDVGANRSALESGLVPVDEIPAASAAVPRARLLRPVPAAWSSAQAP